MPLPKATLTIRRTRVRAEIADTPWALMLGLMFRKSLAPDSGMLLCFRRAGNHGLHMKNVRFPLDVLFLDSGGTIVRMHHAVPGEWGFWPGTPVRYALEVNAGFCRRHRIRTGDRCRLPSRLA